jgi:hypothetical protein
MRGMRGSGWLESQGERAHDWRSDPYGLNRDASETGREINRGIAQDAGDLWGPRSRPRPYRGRGPRNFRRSDERIREEVCRLLTEDASVDATDIEVEVSRGIVRLRGSVGNRKQRRWAEEDVERVWGVEDLVNELAIGAK